MLLTGERVETVRIDTPKGIVLDRAFGCRDDSGLRQLRNPQGFR